MATGPKKQIAFGPSLVLAEKWVKETGRDTQRVMSDPLPDGSRVPLLLVTHGPYQVLIAEQGSCITVSFQTAIPEEVRKKLTELSPEDQRRASITLRGELSSNSRAGCGLTPPDAVTLDQLQAFVVSETLKIMPDDGSTFNRFCDAIQEVVTVGGKGIGVFGLFSSLQTQSTIPVRKGSSPMYS